MAPFALPQIGKIEQMGMKLKRVGPGGSRITRWAWIQCGAGCLAGTGGWTTIVGLLLLLLLNSETVVAATANEIRLASGFDMQVRQFPAKGHQLLLWLPSKYGIREGHTEFASKIQDQGIDYWLVDLHESYLAPTGRDGYEEFEPQHIKELVDHAVRQGWRNIIIGGESRGALLGLRAARQWQLENPEEVSLKGLLFYHPYLIDRYTEIGEQAVFPPIARSTNLPVYILQPQLNTKYLHSEQLIEQLQMGGAPVYFHMLAGVRGGYHVRDVDTLMPREIEERERVDRRIGAAVDLLARLPTPRGAAAYAADTPSEPAIGLDSGATLTPLGRSAAPPLRLTDDRGRVFDLGDHAGEVVLVNFWASWCAPCVKEIASLIRLVDRFENRPFRVVAVNIGESSAHVREFFEIRDITPNFQVVFDIDSTAAKAWRVYAIPSTYLLDRQKKIRYGYRGALRWDKPSVVEIVQGLLE